MFSLRIKFILNIFNLKLNISNSLVIKKKKQKTKIMIEMKLDIILFNSIYYNKNISKLLYIVDKALLKFIKSYFNLYSIDLEKTKKTYYL